MSECVCLSSFLNDVTVTNIRQCKLSVRESWFSIVGEVRVSEGRLARKEKMVEVIERRDLLEQLSSIIIGSRGGVRATDQCREFTLECFGRDESNERYGKQIGGQTVEMFNEIFDSFETSEDAMRLHLFHCEFILKGSNATGREVFHLPTIF